MATGLQPQGAPQMPASPAPTGDINSFGSPAQNPSGLGPMLPSAAPQSPVVNIGGIMPTMSAKAVLDSQQKAIDANVDRFMNTPVIMGLVEHIKKFWSKAEEARRSNVDEDMLDAMYSRRGEYSAEKKNAIIKDGQPLIYMMVGAAKMRQVEALLRDVLIGAGTEKPWTLSPTPVPELPMQMQQEIAMGLQMEVQQALMMGVDVTVEQARARIREVKDQIDAQLMEEARIRCERMEHKMEDQLVEGDYMDAIDQFITDIATYKTAFIAGPVVKNQLKLKWGEGGELLTEKVLTLNWERVDPFDMYPAPWAKNVEDGPLIRRHRLTRESLYEMIGVEGYNEDSIRKVLNEYDNGLHQWLSIDSERADAEGKDSLTATNQTGLIDALQYWGSASGKMLLEWGMPPEQVEDPEKDYQIEAWLIGSYVIKAVMNSDPLARKPYYAASFQRVPGNVWGNSPYDLLRDCQDMCNASARALAANMGISSGPQVYVLSDRMPPGEAVEQMFPWKIWQFESDNMGGNAKPIEFFQPTSNANELMAVYEKFSLLADEYTGVPRYMAGFNEGSGGAGRTASGMSMMIGNASKVIKQVVGGIDFNVIQPMLERLYYYNMRYAEDQDLKGDVCIVARGAMSLVSKEAAQVRVQEFLQATANPIDMQIIGLEGRAEMLRSGAKRLELNADKVVPPGPVLRQRIAQQMMQQAMLMQQQAQAEQGADGKPAGSEQPLQDGSPQTDQFQPIGG